MKDLLTKEHIVKHGVDIKNLISTDKGIALRVKTDTQDLAFTGLGYQLTAKGDLDSYCNYENGVKNGVYVQYYNQSCLKSITSFKFGLKTGLEQVWYKNGKVKSLAEYKYNICLHSMLWDQRGQLLKQKLEPSDEELLKLQQVSKYLKEQGGVNYKL